MSSILDYLNLTSALYIPVDDILIDYDLRTGTQRRVISVSRRNKSDEDDRPIINVIAKTSFDAYGTIITFKPTADNGVTQNHRSHLLLQDDGDRNEGWLSEYLYRFLADHNPIPDSARAVTRTFELSDSQQLAITATRSPTWWYRGLLHPTFRSLSVKMIQGQATIEEQLAFVGARLLGAQFTKAEGQEQFSAHLASGAIFCSSWRQASRRPGDYMLDVVSAVPFDNGPAMQAYDQVFSRLITGRLLDVDVTNFQPDFDDDEEMRPNVDQTILIREEALPIESGTDIGGIFAEDERHQRFHLFLNGPSVQQVPVAITINTGGSVQNWKISLSIAPSKHNTATIIPLLSFIGQLLGVTFERGEIGGAFSGMSLEEVYRAEKNGLGGVLLEKQSQIGDPSFPIHTYNISFFPNDGFDNQTAIDFMKALFARIRGFASENAH
ncbi:MAG: hypothetical protein ACD_62C00444G0001 [uncultured bacterium]|nr:MAG: hypothetical protein ACD_62C00444G0001 [uncultured bacterium]